MRYLTLDALAQRLWTERKGSGKVCLVHCMVGASRSVTMVLCYLMDREGMSLASA